MVSGRKARIAGPRRRLQGVITMARFFRMAFSTMRAWLGTADDAMKLIDENGIEFFGEFDRERSVFSDVKIGKCGETQIPSDYYDSALQKSVPVTWTFDCEKNQFVKVFRQETPRAE